MIKAKLRDKTIYGAVKIHISKGKPFSHKQAEYVATLLFNYLKIILAKRGDVVLPELCLSLDVFADRLTPATESNKQLIAEIKTFCIEIKKIWGTLI